jgi:hypothetical protein
MKVWTYLEQKTKVINDCDLQDEAFIQPDEMIGYFNEAISEAEAEIHGTREKYFLKSAFIPSVVGQSSYNFPDDIYIQKIYRFIYSNGTRIYEIKKPKEWHMFTEFAFTQNFGQNNDYRYYTTNFSPGQTKIVLYPPARETSILPQISPSTAFTPFTLWYFRNASRIPVHGEYVPDYEQFVLPAAINIATDTITLTNLTYVTGDAITLQAFSAPGGTVGLPAPLVAGVTYYVITTGTAGQIKLATTAANAALGTQIDLTTTGSASGYFNLSIAATDLIINAILVDIPEFATFVMQWVKCRCFEKEGDPRLQGAIATLDQQRAQMVDTLTEMIIDSDSEVEPDFTHYQEMS